MKKGGIAFMVACFLMMPLTGQAGFNLGKVLDHIGAATPAEPKAQSAPAEENRKPAQGPTEAPVTQSAEEGIGGWVHYSGGSNSIEGADVYLVEGLMVASDYEERTPHVNIKKRGVYLGKTDANGEFRFKPPANLESYVRGNGRFVTLIVFKEGLGFVYADVPLRTLGYHEFWLSENGNRGQDCTTINFLT